MKRWYITGVNKEGLRCLSFTNDGRLSFTSKKEAEEHLKYCILNSPHNIHLLGKRLKIIYAECRENGECTRTVFED